MVSNAHLLPLAFFVHSLLLFSNFSSFLSFLLCDLLDFRIRQQFYKIANRQNLNFYPKPNSTNSKFKASRVKQPMMMSLLMKMYICRFGDYNSIKFKGGKKVYFFI